MTCFSRDGLRVAFSTILLATSACRSLPKVVRDPASPAATQLVNLRAVTSGMTFDLRYATSSNFTRHQLYATAEPWLRKDAAAALLQVQRDLEKEGLGLKIFDAYRPYHVQQEMWRLIRDDRYVSDPSKNAGRHTRGTAVDVTLVSSDGRNLQMPTSFDDFSERAHRNAPGIPAKAQENSVRLERAMVRRGFIPYPYEWWHFDFAGWESHPPLDLPFSALK